MPVVCLPDAQAVELVGPLPNDVTVVVWEGEPDEPTRLAETEFWVPLPDLPGRKDPQQIVARLPALRVIQTVSAGVDSILPLVPTG